MTLTSTSSAPFFFGSLAFYSAAILLYSSNGFNTY